MQGLNKKNVAFIEYMQPIFYIRTIKTENMVVNGKQERAVIHLEMDGHHYYYGNLKALCDSWDKEEIGVSYNYLKNYGVDEDRPYIGKKCTIRKGTIITSPHKQ